MFTVYLLLLAFKKAIVCSGDRQTSVNGRHRVAFGCLIKRSLGVACMIDLLRSSTIYGVNSIRQILQFGKFLGGPSASTFRHTRRARSENCSFSCPIVNRIHENVVCAELRQFGRSTIGAELFDQHKECGSRSL